MSRRQIAPKFQLWNAVDSTTSPTSDATGTKNLDVVHYEITCDPTVVGTIEVEGSSDDDNAPVKTFYPLDFGTSIVIDGSVSVADEILIKENPYRFLRLKFTNNAGTGSISASVSGNSVGA